jgi:hypothetical protein
MNFFRSFSAGIGGPLMLPPLLNSQSGSNNRTLHNEGPQSKKNDERLDTPG